MSEIVNQFKEKIVAYNFPCIGAKAALCNQTLHHVLLDNMATSETTTILHQSLVKFSKNRDSIDKRFASFVAIFNDSRDVTGAFFESLLWQQLELLAQIDGYKWDPNVSDDVGSENFAFSINSNAYFIIGLCPEHPRASRQFSYPTLVFNSHQQFSYLKQINLFHKIQKAVRQRELLFHGSINPNLADFGEKSEAIQYSGYRKPAAWQCPVRFDK